MRGKYLKYMGSKNRIAKHILPIILKDRKENQWYVEPFVGGANSIDKVNGKRLANDSNKYLLACLNALSKGWIPPKMISKDAYQDIKNNKDSYPANLVGYVGVNCSYSGKWFGGYAGIVQTKQGIRNYINEAFSNVVKQSEKLTGIEFRSGGYLELDIPKNSIIYCDPPYKETTGYSNGFNHREFWDWCKDKCKEGHTVFVSEYQSPIGYAEVVWEKQVSSSLSANGKIGANKKSVEKLFIITR